MITKNGKSLAQWAASFAGALVAATAFAADVTRDRLVNSEREPQNWLNHHGNYEAHRFSGLDQINKSNVKNLKVAFTWAMGGTQGGGKDVIVFPFAGLEGTPIAEDGFLYLTTGWGVVTKLDARGGVPRHGLEVRPCARSATTRPPWPAAASTTAAPCWPATWSSRR